MKRVTGVLIGMIVFPLSVFAARPLATNDAGTVERGALEIEYGIEYVNAFDHETAMSLAFTSGILDTVDIGIEIPYTFIDAKEASDADGFSDINISTKFNFLSGQESLPDMALAFGYTSDSGNDDRGLGGGKPEYELTAIFSKAFDPVSVHLNLGYAFREDYVDEDNEDSFIYGVAVEYPLGEKITLVAEVSGDTVLKRKFHDNACSMLFGAHYAFSERIVFDVGFGTEVSHDEPDFSVTCGITIAL